MCRWYMDVSVISIQQEDGIVCCHDNVIIIYCCLWVYGFLFRLICVSHVTTCGLHVTLYHYKNLNIYLLSILNYR